MTLMARDTTIQMRVDKDEKARWQEHAAVDGLALSDWIRQRCNDVMPLERSPVPAPQNGPSREHPPPLETGHPAWCDCKAVCQSTVAAWRRQWQKG